MLTQYYEKAMEEYSKTKGADENGGEEKPFTIDIKVDDFTAMQNPPEDKNAKAPRRYFTWEFWVIVAVYVLTVSYSVVYQISSAGVKQ
jgi:hypothetical protein